MDVQVSNGGGSMEVSTGEGVFVEVDEVDATGSVMTVEEAADGVLAFGCAVRTAAAPVVVVPSPPESEQAETMIERIAKIVTVRITQ